MTEAHDQLTKRIREGWTADHANEVLRLLGLVVEEIRRDQARVDAELMQMQADRSADTTPPKGGTNSRAVFGAAAQMLHPDELGWSLNLPDHLRPADSQ